MDVFDACNDKKIPVTKSLLIESLFIDESVLSDQPDVVTSPLRLREDQINQFTSNRDALFWINRCMLSVFVRLSAGLSPK